MPREGLTFVSIEKTLVQILDCTAEHLGFQNKTKF
jgi:hypothetical protein